VSGATGVQGVAGMDGVTGIQGDTGIQGQTGIQGVTGSNIGNYFDFTPQAFDPFYMEGRTFYDATSHMLSYFLDGTSMTVDVGRENLVRVYNNSGSNISAGSAVYITGVASGYPTVNLAQGSNLSKTETIGLVSAFIPNNSFGYVNQFGIVENINTSGFSPGSEIYLSDSTAGSFTNVKGIYGVKLGYVLTNDTLSGSVLTILGDRESTIAGLNDVTLTGLSNDQYLRYDSTSAKWVNVSAGAGGGATGVAGATGIQGTQGITGASGTSSGLQTAFNNVSRYSVVDTTGEEVWIVSSSTVYGGVDWTRSGTTLTISRTAHGHSAGNRVIVRNTNMDYQTLTIDTTTANTFNVPTLNSGSTSGSLGSYSLGFTYVHNGIPKLGGSLSAPTGDHADVQLLSMRVRTGSRSGTTYDVVVPASAVNGAGTNTNLGNCFMPDFNVRSDSDSMSAIAATMTTNISGSYNTFQIGNLGNSALSRFIILHF
jgi:hypothetical protein